MPDEPAEFGFLQMRPLVLSREGEDIAHGGGRARATGLPELAGAGTRPHRRTCATSSWSIPSLRARSQSRGGAQRRPFQRQAERDQGTPYLLIGVGRWGSTDPWLGIPVTWDQISGARVIVEAGFRDFRVAPSQGSHFFQNLTAFQIGYFTVNPDAGEGFVDWEWLAAQKAVDEHGCVRHLRFPAPLTVMMNGKTSRGMIFKPDATL